MKNIFSTLLVGAAFVFGCGGGGGGVDDSATVGSLSASDAKAFCNQLASEYPPKSVTCSGESETIGINADECTGSGSDQFTIPSGCTATVGQADDCFGAEYDDPCGSGSAAATACAPLEVAACEGD